MSLGIQPRSQLTKTFRVVIIYRFPCRFVIDDESAVVPMGQRLFRLFPLVHEKGKGDSFFPSQLSELASVACTILEVDAVFTGIDDFERVRGGVILGPENPPKL